MNRVLLLAVGALALVGIGPARDTVAEEKPSRTSTTQTDSTRSETTFDLTQEGRLAKSWGLKRDEWTRYRDLMRGPLGIYSPSIDPLTALGIEARSDAERRRYAQMQVRAEGVRVEKLLAYQRAYDEAWKQLYPSLSPVNLTKKTHGRVAQPLASKGNPVLAVFVRADCSACDAQVRALQASGRNFDIYMLSTRGDDAVIRAWASRAGVDPKRVKERAITLNHDGGRWLSVGDGGSLPAVLRKVDGKWRRD